jgi:hypothetical protein
VTTAPHRLRLETAIKALFEDREPAAATALLREDARLKPPTYWKTWEGVEPVRRLLGFAAYNIDKLVYTHIYWDGPHAAFQFIATVGGMELSGVDLVTLDDAGRIQEIEIVARPPKTVALLGERMGASLRQDPFFATMASQTATPAGTRP